MEIQIKNIIFDSNESPFYINDYKNYNDYYYKIYMSDGNVIRFQKFKEIKEIYGNNFYI